MIDGMKHPLHAYRESEGLTQQQLADALGCSQPLIALIEKWERGVTKENAEDWEKKTGLPRLSLMYPKEFPLKSDSHGRRSS